MSPIILQRKQQQPISNIMKALKIFGFFLLLFCLTQANAADNTIGVNNEFSNKTVIIPVDDFIPTFEHPGIMHNSASIARMREIVNKADTSDVAYRAWKGLKSDFRAQSDYELRGPYSRIARQDEYAYTKKGYEADFNAAYMNAIMWVVTGDESHARKAAEIMTAYANKLEEIPAHNDKALLAGLETFKLAFALEMISHTSNIMPHEDIECVNNMLRSVFLPVLDEFLVSAPYTNGNWGLSVAHSKLALSILWDDLKEYQRTIDFLLNGYDNGAFPRYFDMETGQCQESGRDQGHVQLGLCFAIGCCEIAWKQGNDLYSKFDNLVHKATEYTARYNAGHDDVPFKKWTDVTGKYCDWETISSKNRGDYWSLYGCVYNHYVNRKKMEMPYTLQILEKNGWKAIYTGIGMDYDLFQFTD